MTIPSGASQTTIRDIPPRLRSQVSRPFDVLRIVGVTEWGPMGEATVSVDYDDWASKFGGFLANYQTAIAVREFFAAGGMMVVTARTCHYSGGSPLTAAKAYATAQTGAGGATKPSVTGSIVGPFALTHNMTLVGSVDRGADQTVTFTATAAAVENTPAETYALTNGQVLTVKIDAEAVAQSVAFLTAEFVNIAAATAEEVAAVINAKLLGAQATVTSGGTKVTITSDRKGTGSWVEVTGGTANAVLAFSTAPVQGTGNVSNISSVSVGEIETLVEAAWTNGGGVAVTSAAGAVKIETAAAGAGVYLQVKASSTADTALGLDNAEYEGSDGAAVNTLKLWGKYYGALGNNLSCTIGAASNGEAARFDLAVYKSSVLMETWRNLTMDSTDTRYAVDVFAAASGGSSWISGEDLAAPGTATQKRPANGSATLTSGSDGLGSLDYTDFIGADQYGTGLYAFDVLPDDGDILVCPDCTTVAFCNAATAKCETDWKGTCIYIPDPPAASSYSGIVTQAQNLTASECRTGIPWPRVKIPNPDRAVYGTADLITICPSAPWAARMVWNSQHYSEMVFKQPSNPTYGLLPNVVDVERDEVQKQSVRNYVTPYMVNPIIKGKTSDGVYGVWVNDCQSGKVSGNWRTVGEIRGVALIKKDLWAFAEQERTQANTVDARWQQKFTLDAYLLGWCMRGVFATSKPADAFYVNTDPEGVGINNPLEQEAQKLNWVIGLATAQAARFIDIGVTRDQRSVEIWVQKAMASV